MRVFKAGQAALAMVLGAALLAGCAGTQSAKGPSDRELIAQLQQSCLDAVANNDVAGLLALFSDDFENSYLGNKTSFESFLNMAKDQGYFDGIVIDMDGAELEIDGASATMYPVAVEGSFGQVTIEFVSEKRDGKWIITGMDLDM